MDKPYKLYQLQRLLIENRRAGKREWAAAFRLAILRSGKSIAEVSPDPTSDSETLIKIYRPLTKADERNR